MRDLNTNPYSPEEARVAKYLSDKGIGGGDDPIGFLLSSYDYVIAVRNQQNKLLGEYRTKYGVLASKMFDS